MLLKKKKKDYLIDYLTLSIIIFVAPFKLLFDDEIFELQPLPFGLYYLQLYSNVIVVAIFGFSIIRKIKSPSKNKIQNYLGLLMFYFFSLLVILFDKDVQLFRILFVTILLIYCLFCLSDMVFYRKDNYSIIKSVFFGTLSILFLSVFLFFVSPESVIWKGRFFGMTSHPNFIGLIFAINTCLSFFFFTEEIKIKIKIFYIIVILCSLFMSFSTGSRTSLGLCVFSILLIIFFKIKYWQSKLFLFLMMSILILLNLSNLSFKTFDYENRGNTRSETWKNLWNSASEFPLLGVGRTGDTTNSYLYAIVAAGTIGFIFLLISIFFLFKYTKISKGGNSSVQVFKVLLILILIGGITEGYLLDNISIPVFLYWILLSFPLNYKNQPK